MRQTQEEIQGLRFPSDGKDEKEPAKETKKERKDRRKLRSVWYPGSLNEVLEGGTSD